MLADKLRSATGAADVSDLITLVESGSAMLTQDNPVNFSTDLIEDDLVLLHYIAIDDSAVTHPAGYTVVPVFDLDGGRDQSWYAYKKMGASPDTSFEITDVGGGGDGLSLTYYVFRGVDPVTPFDTTSVGVQSINPASITTVTDNSFVLVTTFASGKSSTVTAAPSGYSNLQWVNATAGNDATTASALKFVSTAGAEDPGEFTFSTTHTDYYSIVHALRPATVPYVGPITTSIATVASLYNTQTSTSYSIDAGTVGMRITSINRFDPNTTPARAAPSGWIAQDDPTAAYNADSGTLTSYAIAVHWTDGTLDALLNTDLSISGGSTTFENIAVSVNYPTNALLQITTSETLASVAQWDLDTKIGGGTGGTLSVYWPGHYCGFLLVVCRAEASSSVSITSSDVTLGSKVVIDGNNDIDNRFAYFVDLGGNPAQTINLTYSTAAAAAYEAILFVGKK